MIFSRQRRALLISAIALLPLTGCESVKVWPFDGKSTPPQARAVANAIEFQCAGGKRFHVRTVDNGAAAWLIYPDREVSLPRSSGNSNRYSNGIAVLEINGNEASLTDGPTTNYTGCKAAGK